MGPALGVIGFLALTAPETAFAQGFLNVGEVPEGGITLSGDELVCDEARCEVVGNVLLQSGSTLLQARALELDFEPTADGKRRISGARARGDVLLVDGNAMTACEFIELGPDLVQGALSLAEIRVKKPGTTGALEGWDRFGAGRDQLYVSGQISRTSRNTFVVRDVYFTPCDCGKAPPIFAIKAKKATIELGSHAIFEAPVLMPFNQPLPFPFALPYLYVPVSKRKTGLLPPGIMLTSFDGPLVEESVFFVLHPSVDMTATVGMSTNRGPRDKLELRYAPSPDVYGLFEFSHMFDVLLGSTAIALPDGESRRLAWETGQGVQGIPDGRLPLSHRMAATLSHRSGTWSRFSTKAELQVYSDAAYLFHNRFTVQAQATEYMPSRLAFDYRGDLWRASVGAAAYQDFRVPGGLYGAVAGRTLQRAPEVGLHLAPTPLPLGFRFAADARFAGGFALGGAHAARYDRALDRTLDPMGMGIPSGPTTISEYQGRPPDDLVSADCSALETVPVPPMPGTVNLRQGVPCQKPLRFGRVDVVPRLSRPFGLGPVSFHPELFGLFAVGVDGIDTRPRPRGFAAFRFDASTELARVFAKDEEKKTAWRHRIRPLARYLLIPGVFGALPRYRFDERDFYRVTHQLAFGVETDLYRRSEKGGAREVLSLALFQPLNLPWPAQANDPALAANPQSFDQPQRNFGELAGRLRFTWSPVTLWAEATLSHAAGKLTQQEYGVSVNDGKYIFASVSYVNFRAGGYWRMNTGLFELAPAGAIVPDPLSGALDMANLNLSVTPVQGTAFGTVSLSYSLAASFASTRGPFSPQGMRARLAYTGACDCFGVDFGAMFLPQFFTAPGEYPPIFSFAITVGDYTFRPQ